MDQYPDVSIKNPEWAKRSAAGTIQITIQDGNQKCPTQWKKFLSDGGNKTKLASFLVRVAAAKLPGKVGKIWHFLCHSWLRMPQADCWGKWC